MKGFVALVVILLITYVNAIGKLSFSYGDIEGLKIYDFGAALGFYQFSTSFSAPPGPSIHSHQFSAGSNKIESLSVSSSISWSRYSVSGSPIGSFSFLRTQSVNFATCSVSSRKYFTLPPLSASISFGGSMSFSSTLSVLSLKRTSSPSIAPTISPTASPTKMSTNDSSIATKNPTQSPTQFPTIAPTVHTPVPTIMPSMGPNNRFDEILILAESLVVDNSLSFVEILSLDSNYSSRTWNNFTALIPEFDPSVRPTSVSLAHFIYGNNSIGNVSFVCRDSFAISGLWNGFLSRYSVTYFCGSATWVLRYCSGFGMSLCVNCEDPCSRSYLELVVPLHRLTTNEIVGSMVQFEIEPKIATYPIWNQSCSIQHDSVVVSYDLNSSGLIACNIYQTYIPSLSSSLLIGMSGGGQSKVVLDNSRSNNFTFSTLDNHSKYYVLCYTENLLEIPGRIFRSPLALSYQLMCSVNYTSSSLSIASASIDKVTFLQDSLIGPLSLVLSSYPKHNISFQPTAQYLSTSACSKPISTPSAWNVSHALTKINFHSHVSFSSQSPFLTSNIYFSASVPGCYFLNFSISGREAGNYVVRYMFSGNHNISSVGIPVTIVSKNKFIPPLGVSSMTYTGFGSEMRLLFSSSTDMGKSVGLNIGTWACSLALNFTGVQSATCKFGSPSSISISFPSDFSGFPIVGKKAVIFGGIFKISSDVLSSYGLIENGTVYNVPYMDSCDIEITGSSLVHPHPVILSPSQISLNTSFTLDISSSSGNGGFPWKSVLWTASLSGVTLPSLENYMNSEMQWYNCTPRTVLCNQIDGSWATVTGTYLFSVTLINAWGFSATASTSMTVLSMPSIPHMAVVGPVSNRVFPNQSFSILANVNPSFLSSKSNIEYSWLVFRNGKIDSSVVDICADHRIFTIAPYSLLPNNEYVFRASAIDTTYSTYSVSDYSLFVLSGEIIPVIKGPNIATLTVPDNVILDASSSFYSGTGLTSDLHFTWSCMQLTPINSSGCDFFSLFAANTPKIEFSSSFLNGMGSSYQFTVCISSFIVAGNECTSKIIYSLSPVSNCVPPEISIPNSVAVIDNTLPYVMDFLVKYTGRMKVMWSVISVDDQRSITNSSISQLQLTSVGLVQVPLYVPAHQMVSQSLYSFRLVATPLASDGGEIISASTFASISLKVNSPPRFGDVRSFPTEGTELTWFTIYAINWLDENLPLTYSFFQRASAPSTDKFLLRQNSQLTYVSTFLSHGDSSDRFATIIETSIIDNLQSQASFTFSVSVMPSGLNLSSSISFISSYFSTGYSLKSNDIVLSSMNSLLRSSCSVECYSNDLWNMSLSSCWSLLTEGIGHTRNLVGSSQSVEFLLSITSTLRLLTHQKIFPYSRDSINTSLDIFQSVAQSFPHSITLRNVEGAFETVMALGNNIASVASIPLSVSIQEFVLHSYYHDGNTNSNKNRILASPRDQEFLNTTSPFSVDTNALPPLSWNFSMHSVDILESSMFTMIRGLFRSSSNIGFFSYDSSYFHVNVSNYPLGQQNISLPSDVDLFLNQDSSCRYAVMKSFLDSSSLGSCQSSDTTSTTSTTTATTNCSSSSSFQSSKIFLQVYFDSSLSNGSRTISYHVPIHYPYDVDPSLSWNHTVLDTNLSCANTASSHMLRAVSSLQNLSYSCPSSVTYGPSYTFTNITCPSESNWIEVSCPLYQPEVACAFFSDKNATCTSYIAGKKSMVCRCTFNSNDDSTLSTFSIYSEVSANGSFVSLSDPMVHVFDLSLPATSHSSQSSLNIIAIVSLCVVFVIFSGIGVKKLYLIIYDNAISTSDIPVATAAWVSKSPNPIHVESTQDLTVGLPVISVEGINPEMEDEEVGTNDEEDSNSNSNSNSSNETSQSNSNQAGDIQPGQGNGSEIQVVEPLPFHIQRSRSGRQHSRFNFARRNYVSSNAIAISDIDVLGVV